MTRWKFINRGTIRPYRVTSRWTGQELEANTWTNLVRAYVKHHEQQGIFLPKDWERDLHTDYCVQNKLEGLECEKDTGNKQYPGPADLVRFAQTFLGWIVKGSLKPVAAEESTRRAAICADCPENVEYVHGCFGCLALGPPVAEATRLLGNMTTPHDDRLHNCAACGCVLKLKVHTPEEFLRDDHVAYPPHCWRYKGGE